MKRALVVHSQYRDRGGEERAIEIEMDAFKAAGVNARLMQRAMPARRNPSFKLKIALGLFRQTEAAHQLKNELKAFDPQVVHFHNIMPHWGYGSVLATLDWALRKGRSVVSTIHNQRWVCANGLFFRNGQHCQLCMDRRNSLWGAIHNCRENRTESALYGAAISWAWARNIYNHPSHTLIALNPLTAQRLRRHFPVARVEILSNPVTEPNPTPGVPPPHWDLPDWIGKRVAVIGRLSPEKGVLRLLSEILNTELTPQPGSTPRTENLARDPGVQFLFAGAGPLQREVELAAEVNPRVIYLGQISEEAVPGLLTLTGALFHAGLVEEQSPTVVRLAASLRIPVYGWAGRWTLSNLQQWGPVLSTREWGQRLVSVLGF